MTILIIVIEETPFVSEQHLPWYILIRTQIKKVLYESDLPYGYQDEK